MRRRAAALVLGLALAAAVPAAANDYDDFGAPERHGIQMMLIWTGDLHGLAEEAFGPPTLAAIRSFQARAGVPADGTLETDDMALLQAAAAQVADAAGFAATLDPVTGMVLGLPRRLAARSASYDDGMRYGRLADGMQVDTWREAGTAADLAEQYGRALALYPIRAADAGKGWFFVATKDDGSAALYRYAAADGELRGVAIFYDPARPGLARVADAVLNSLIAFPTAEELPLAAAP